MNRLGVHTGDSARDAEINALLKSNPKEGLKLLRILMNAWADAQGKQRAQQHLSRGKRTW